MNQNSHVSYRRFTDDNHSDVDLDTDEASQDRAMHDDWNANYSMPSQHGAAARPIHVISNRAQIDRPQNATDSVNTSGSFQPSLLRSGSLSSRALEFVASKFAAGSIKGSIFTMCISIVGAGCLALPYAVRNVGLILGLLLILLSPLLAYFTMDLLLISAEYLPEELRGNGPLRSISYQTLALHSYGPKLSKALQYLMAVQYFGSMIAYVVAFSGFIDLVYSIFRHDPWPDSIYTYCVVGICYGIIFPLSLLRSMNSLRFTSVLGFSMAIYLVCAVIAEYFALCSNPKTDDPHFNGCFWQPGFHFDLKRPTYNMLWPMDDFHDFYSGFLTAFPLIIFAYTGHPFLLPLYVELARPSIRRIRKVYKRGFGICCVLYTFISVFGFLLFVDKVCSNLLLNHFQEHRDVVIAALGISLSCILTEPIFAYNFRRMIGMLAWNKTTNEISTFWHVVITFLFVSVNVALGVAVKSIAVVFGFLGSTTYPTLGYLLPAAFFCKITPPGKYRTRKIIAVVQAVIVAMISLFSLIYKFAHPGDEECDAAQSIG